MSSGVNVRPPLPTSIRMVLALATAEKAATARVEKSILAVVLCFVLLLILKEEEKETIKFVCRLGVSLEEDEIVWARKKNIKNQRVCWSYMLLSLHGRSTSRHLPSRRP